MPNPTLRGTVAWLRASAEGRGDRELLARFAEGDEGAFAELVRRHGPMVLGVCERVLGNRDDAEDAHQSTFLALAQRAGRDDWRESIAGWLHDVAWRTATKMRVRRVRRRASEQQVPVHETTGSANDWPEVLDDEVRKLPTAMREAVLCCYFQGLTRQQAATKLGCSLRTLERRLDQGRCRLRERLEVRGEPVPLLLAGPAFSLTSVLGRWWLVAGLLLVTGGVLAAWPRATGPRVVPTSTPIVKSTTPADPPLPRHAIARLGETRFRGGAAHTLAFSPDGILLATGGYGGGYGLCLWEARTGRLVRSLSEKDGRTESLAFSPDGKQLVVARAWSVRILDVATLALVRDLGERHANGVEHVAWSDDGKWIASASRDETVRIWDATAGKVAHVLKVGKRPGQIVFSPRSKYLATTAEARALCLWDPATGKELHRFEEKAGVGYAAFSPDGAILAWAAGEGVLRAWDTDGRGPPWDLSKGEGYFGCPVFSPDGRTIAATFPHSGIRLLDAKTGRETRRWKVANNWVGALAYSPDGKTLVSGGRWACIPQRWDPTTGREIDPSEGHVAWATGLSFPPGGATLLSLGADNKVIRWDLATRAPKSVRLPDFRMGQIHTFSPDGKTVAVGGLDSQPNGAKLFDVATGKQLRVFTGGKEEYVRSLAFTNDGKRLAAAMGQGGTLRIWDLTDAKTPPVQIGGRDGGIRYGRRGNFPVLFSHDGRRLLNAGLDGILRLYDTATGKLLHAYDMGCETGGLAFAPDDRLVAVLVEPDKPTILLWDPDTGKVARSWETGHPGITNVAFSPDGRLLATGSLHGFEYSVQLWDVATKQELESYTGHPNPGGPLAFSRDGRTLATGSGDSTVLLWDVTGRAGLANAALTPKRLQELWQALAAEDAKKAFAATWELALSTDGAVPFLRDRVKPVTAADQALVDRLVKKLGADDFATRDRATRELEQLGAGAIPRLRKALEAVPDLEVRRRIETSIASYHRGDEWQRQRQALAVLERGDSAAARKLVDELARGADGAPLTEEARAVAARRKRP